MANSSNSYQGRLALVTGGSQGIGLALARLLAEEGANVWLLARHADALEAACRSLDASSGQKHSYIAADVTDLNQVKAAVERVEREAGLPDLLINCAGGSHPGYVQEIPPEVFREMMNLNYFGTLHTVQALLPHMIQRGSGCIVNFSSTAGVIGVFGYSAYGAAKFAVRGFSDVLRAEVKPLGIQVSVVFPPNVDTPGLANENKTKPFETHEVEGNAGVFAPAKLAQTVLDGVQRGHRFIVPGFENKIAYYLLSGGLLGKIWYPFQDVLLAQARRKKQKVKGSNGHL
jgi:3-dehydrosphinganine reductase